MHNTLVEKINADADAQVATIEAAAAADVAVIQKETQRVVQQLEDEAAVALSKKKKQIELVGTAKANQAAKISQQAAKREGIDALFAKVEAEVLQESGAAYVARYTKLAQAGLPQSAEVLSVLAPAAKMAETKEILTTLGITVVAEASAAVRAGLIVTTTDGVYDVSFDRLLSDVRPALEMELAHSAS